MMVTLLHGENDFEKREALKSLIGDREVSRSDGEELTFEKLQELTIGQALFATDEIKIIDGLSENTDLWAKLSDILPETADIILVENKLDKRTKTYKWLTKHAKTQEFLPLDEKQRGQLVVWIVARAKYHGYEMSRSMAQELIDRLGYDQQRLDMVLGQLSLVDSLTEETLRKIVPLAKSENVFELLEAAVMGRRDDVSRIIAYLEQSEGSDGAYMTLGLLASQLFSLNALFLAGGDSTKVAADFSVHPFVLKKLAPLARNLSDERLQSLNDSLSLADVQMKSTSTEPWMLLEMALIGNRGVY